MATKKKKRSAPKRSRARSTRKQPAPTPMPSAQGSGLPIWPFLLLALIGVGIYFFLRTPSADMVGPARKVAPEQAAKDGGAIAPAGVEGAVTRPASPEGNIAGEGVSVWDRAQDPKVTFKVMRGEGEAAEVRIFSSKNKLAKLLRSEAGPRGWVNLVWDGLDEKGQKVAPGTYFARISREGGDVIQELRVL